MYFLIYFKFYKNSLYNLLYLYHPLEFCHVIFSLNGIIDNFTTIIIIFFLLN